MYQSAIGEMLVAEMAATTGDALRARDLVDGRITSEEASVTRP
jgi:hypothetical protein